LNIRSRAMDVSFDNRDSCLCAERFYVNVVPTPLISIDNAVHPLFSLNFSEWPALSFLTCTQNLTIFSPSFSEVTRRKMRFIKSVNPDPPKFSKKKSNLKKSAPLKAPTLENFEPSISAKVNHKHFSWTVVNRERGKKQKCYEEYTPLFTKISPTPIQNRFQLL